MVEYTWFNLHTCNYGKGSPSIILIWRKIQVNESISTNKSTKGHDKKDKIHCIVDPKKQKLTTAIISASASKVD